VATSADADRVIEDAQVFDSVAEAVADCTRVFATTARTRARQLPAVEVSDAVGEMNDKCAILFGPEASGLDNDSLSHADRLLDIPVNPEFSSLNLAQAVLLVGWEWWRGKASVTRSPEEPATKRDLDAFLVRLEAQLDKGSFFSSETMRPETVRNLRALFGRAAPTDRELRLLHGVVTELASRGEVADAPELKEP
jgi:TrmH family RNA methyltransferase